MTVRTPAATTIPCQPCDKDVDEKDVGQDAGSTYNRKSCAKSEISERGLAVRMQAAGTIARRDE